MSDRFHGEQSGRTRSPDRDDALDRGDAPAARSALGTRRRFLGSLAAAGGAVLAGCGSVDPLGSGPVWRQALPDATAAGSPTVAGDLLVVGAQDRAIHGFAVDDGTRAFALETGGPVETQPVGRADGPVHAHSTDGDLYAAGRDGETVWHHEGQERDAFVARASGTVFRLQGDDPSMLTGYDAVSGERRVRLPVVGYHLPGLGPGLAAVPAVENGERRLLGFDPADGTVRWRAETDRGPAAADDGLVVTGHEVGIAGRNPSDGTVRWTRGLERIEWYRGVALGDHVAVTMGTESDGDRLALLSREDGSVRSRTPVGAQVRWVRSLDDGMLVGTWIEGEDGDGVRLRVDAIDPDGSARWRTVLGQGDSDSLAVTDAVVGVSIGDEVAVLDRDDGSIRRRYQPEDGRRLRLAAGEKRLFAVHGDGGVVVRLPVD